MSGVPESFSFATVDVPGAATGYTKPYTIYDINDRGEVTGTYFDQNLSVHGFVERNGAFTTIDVPTAVFPPGQSIETEVRAINDKGEAAGRYFALGGTGPSHGFIDDHGVFTFVDVPASIAVIPGGYGFPPYTQIHGINDTGGVVGTYGDSNHNNHGYLDDNGTFTTIDFPDPNATATNPEGINDRGDIVGSYVTLRPETQVHGFIDQGGVLTTIDVPGAASTDIHGINDNGALVGTYTDDNMKSHGFIYDNGSFATIDFPGASGTEAWGINDGGEIAGNYIDSSGNSHGFVANPLDNPVQAAFASLKDLLAGQPATLSMKDFASAAEAAINRMAPQHDQPAGTSAGSSICMGSSDTAVSCAAAAMLAHAG